MIIFLQCAGIVNILVILISFFVQKKVYLRGSKIFITFAIETLICLIFPFISNKQYTTEDIIDHLAKLFNYVKQVGARQSIENIEDFRQIKKLLYSAIRIKVHLSHHRSQITVIKMRPSLPLLLIVFK